MVRRKWSDEQAATIERLENLLFNPNVAAVTITGDAEVVVTGAAVPGEATERLIIAEEIMRDVVNDLLLPYAERKPQPRGSKSGNPAKRAAENRARGVEETPVKVRGTTGLFEATVVLPPPEDQVNLRALRLALHSIWIPGVPHSVVTLTKLDTPTR